MSRGSTREARTSPRSTRNAGRAAPPTVLVTALADGAQRLVKAQDIAADPLAELLDKQLRMGKSGSGRTRARPISSPCGAAACLVIIGAVHVSQALAEMARWSIST